jgi:hypothetical protein
MTYLSRIHIVNFRRRKSARSCGSTAILHCSRILHGYIRRDLPGPSHLTPATSRGTGRGMESRVPSGSSFLPWYRWPFGAPDRPHIKIVSIGVIENSLGAWTTTPLRSITDVGDDDRPTELALSQPGRCGSLTLGWPVDSFTGSDAPCMMGLRDNLTLAGTRARQRLPSTDPWTGADRTSCAAL